MCVAHAYGSGVRSETRLALGCGNTNLPLAAPDISLIVPARKKKRRQARRPGSGARPTGSCAPRPDDPPRATTPRPTLRLTVPFSGPMNDLVQLRCAAPRSADLHSRWIDKWEVPHFLRHRAPASLSAIVIAAQVAHVRCTLFVVGRTTLRVHVTASGHAIAFSALAAYLRTSAGRFKCPCTQDKLNAVVVSRIERRAVAVHAEHVAHVTRERGLLSLEFCLEDAA
jgi:hypothetical protein